MKRNFDDVPEFSWSDMFRALWYFLEGYRRTYIFWSTTLFVVFFYQLIPPLIIGNIINFFTTYQPGDPLTPFYGYVIFLGIAHAVSAIIRLTSKNKIAELGTETNYNVKVKGFEKLVDFSLAWHDKENTGNKVQRIQNGVTSLGDFRRLMSQDGFQTITAILGIIVIFIFLSPIFVVFLLVYMAVFLFINYSFYRKMLTTHNEFNEVREQASGSYFEGLSNVLTIKTLGAQDSFKKNIHSAEQHTKELGYKLISIGINKWKAFQIFNAVSLVVYLLMVGHNLVTGVITIGSIFVFHNYLMKLIDAAGTSTDVFERLIEIKAAVARMMPIYWDKEPVAFGNSDFPDRWHEIRIANGAFGYKGSPTKSADDLVFEIKGLNFTIKQHEKIGIAGASGSGKSTLAKLLLGLYQLKDGAFTVGQTNFYDIKHSEITSKIAIVLQETEMFNLSLEENITLLRNVDPKLLKKAITIAQLEDLILKLPNGIQTIIGEKGYRLSGGERQRIGIARAICKDPQIFVFDEATSALDNTTESYIQHAIETELHKKALIIIAHRITTLKNVDKICVFEKGNIIEEGTYDQLINNPQSAFYKISRVEQRPAY